jgi:hypothetical protein
MILFSLTISIIALILAVLSLCFGLVIKLYYLDKLIASNDKQDPYEKYRTVDGLLSKKVVNEVKKK